MARRHPVQVDGHLHPSRDGALCPAGLAATRSGVKAAARFLSDRLSRPLRYGVPDRSRRDTLDIVQAVPAFPVEGRGHCHDLTMSFRDVAAWFAIPAFVVSAAAFGFTRYTNRRNLLLRIHELLLDLQNQRGRRLLHLVAAADGWDELNEENRELINHALAMFDVLGFYVARRYVKFDDAHDLWEPAAILAWERAAPYIQDRRATEQRPVWPYFERFAEDARRQSVTASAGHPTPSRRSCGWAR